MASHMAREIESIPLLTQGLLKSGQDVAQQTGERLRLLDPAVVTTIARGSSDHAAAYLKYVIELSLGIPVASTGPSIGSVYNAPMRLGRAATIAISQSGKSPDIVAMAQTAKIGGSLLMSLTNDSASPLANLGDRNIDISAGPERSVAATKTFVLSIVAGLMVVAHWKQDDSLLTGLEQLPSDMEQALDCDWAAIADSLAEKENNDQSLYVLGRGPSFAIAKECALKFKETCQLHAEAYSSAEVMHGPVSIAQKGFTVLGLASPDVSGNSVLEASEVMADQGVDVFVTSSQTNLAHTLPSAPANHEMTTPLVQVISFYKFIEQLSRRLGLNPDEPPHLKKVTETV